MFGGRVSLAGGGVILKHRIRTEVVRQSISGDLDAGFRSLKKPEFLVRIGQLHGRIGQLGLRLLKLFAELAYTCRVPAILVTRKSNTYSEHQSNQKSCR